MPQVYPGIQSGGRTRHIINMASPGNEEELAYTFTEATDAPSAATAGYKNPGLQKTLHVLLMNNNAGTCKFRVWGYHSFAKKWGVLQIIDPADGGNNVVEITMVADADAHVILSIEGLERIAVQCSTWAGSNNVTCYLGVNTI